MRSSRLTGRTIWLLAPFERNVEAGGSQRATTIAERLEGLGAEVVWLALPPTPRTQVQKVKNLLSLRPELVAPYDDERSLPSHPRPDVVITEHSFLVEQLERVRSRFPDARTILDFHNLEFRHVGDLQSLAGGPKRLYLAWEARRMARFERRALRRADVIVFVSADEQEWASKTEPELANRLLIPNLLPRRNVEQAVEIARRRAAGAADGSTRFVYIGTLTFPPNLQALLRFVDTSWGVIHRAAPEAGLWVVGCGPAEGLSRLAAAPGVDVKGFVEDPTDLLATCAGVILPLAMSAGSSLRTMLLGLARVPIVATPWAFRGLAEVAGGVRDEPECWADAVTSLLGGDPCWDEQTAALALAVQRRQDDPQPWERLTEAILCRSDQGAPREPRHRPSRRGRPSDDRRKSAR